MVIQVQVDLDADIGLGSSTGSERAMFSNHRLVCCWIVNMLKLLGAFQTKLERSYNILIPIRTDFSAKLKHLKISDTDEKE